jgi:hypothetical protein
VIVFSPKGEKFTLYVNGGRQNSEPENRVETANPGGPTFKIRVAFMNSSIPDLNKTIFNKPGSTIYYKIDKNQKGVYILESTSMEWMDDENVKEPENKTEPAVPAEKKATTGKGPGDSEPDKNIKQKGCDNPMSENDFNANLVGISARPFDPMKLSAAKKLAETNCLLASQVRTVMYVFDSESSRLSFAKFAYDHTWDPGNYSEVADALHSDRSKDDLDKYIAGKKK